MKSPVAPQLMGLVGPFTRIARAMSSEHNVQIVPTGATCATNGDVIAIPFTADFLPDDARQRLHGMLDHEVCHVSEERRHKAAGRTTPIQLLAKVEDKRERFLMNVVEDVRIERRYSKRYPGVAENLAALNRHAATEWAGATAEEVGWWQMFCAAINLQAQGLDVPWSSDPALAPYLDACKGELDAMRAGVGQWGSDSLALARRIFAKVKDLAKEQKKQKPKTDDSDDEEGAHDGDGMGAGAGEDEESDDSETGDDDAGERERRGGGDVDTDTDSGPTPKEEEREPKKAKQLSPDDDTKVEDLIDIVRTKLEEYVIHDAQEHSRYIPHPKAQALDTVTEASGPQSLYLLAREEVTDQIRTLRQKQLALLSSWKRRRLRSGLESGDVDDNALADVRLGARDVFSDLTKRRQLNTAITGLIDCSGSMGTSTYPGSGSFYAMRTAIALAEAWSGLGIANEWLGFTVHDYRDAGITEDDLKGPFFCRPPLRHLVFKSFDQPLRAARASMGGITGHGSNVDGEAVVWAFQRLIVRPETRKILVVVSDGQPSTWSGCWNDRRGASHWVLQDHLREAIKMVTSAGVEVLGIGAGTAMPKHFYNADTGAKFVHVANMSTLAVDVFKVMSQKVTDRT